MIVSGRAAVLFLFVVFLILLMLALCSKGWRKSTATTVLLKLGDVVATCRLVSEDPVIRVVDGFMTPKECQDLIKLYEKELKPSTVADDKDNTINRPNPNRTSWTAFMQPGKDGDLIERIERRAVALSGKPLRNMETLQLVRYQPPGQHYAPHFDFFHNDPESQRTVTCFVYLNDTDEEAPTHFSKLGIDVHPKQGRACIWDNAPTHGRGHLCDRRLEHAGMPVKTKTKYGLNIWFRSMPFR